MGSLPVNLYHLRYGLVADPEVGSRPAHRSLFWALGRTEMNFVSASGHGWTIYQGDCLEVMPMLDLQVDAIITDLPYGTTQCAWDVVIPFAPMWAQSERILKPGGVFVTTASQPFTSLLVCSNLDWFRYEWIWKKKRITGYLDANRRPMKAHENIVVFGKSIKYYPQMTKGEIHKSGAKPEWAGQAKVYGKHERILSQSDMWYPRSVIEFAADPITTVTKSHRPHKRKIHPTKKPIALYEYLIQTYTLPGETVLDLAAGSGTTGEAAIRTGRKFIGIEKEPEYFQMAVECLRSAHPGMPALHTSAQPQFATDRGDSATQFKFTTFGVDPDPEDVQPTPPVG